MKTKYVFVIDDDTFGPLGLERCYIFDNLDDARSFYTGKGYSLEVYSCNDKFCISKTVNWHGNIYKGLFVFYY